MKITKITFAFVIILLIISNISVTAQNNSNYQAYLIHEDRVKPSMVDEYEQISKDLVKACVDHNIQNNSWLTVVQDDNTYLYVTPMEKFADIDNNPFSTLSEKMGKDKISALFDRFNPCYDQHGDYVVYLNKNLSYMPGGMSQTTEGKPYRIFYYNYITPSNNKNFVAVLKKVKDIFTKKNSKLDYRIYKTGFGVIGTYYMVVISGVNAEEIAKSMNENWELMKSEFKPLLTEMSKYTWKNDKKTGWIRTDLSYTPKK